MVPRNHARQLDDSQCVAVCAISVTHGFVWSVAGELADRGHLERVDPHHAREQMIDAYFEWHSRGKSVSLVTGTIAEADAINEAIQQRRLEQGKLDSRVEALGMDAQRILVGDTVQTRRNDRRTGARSARRTPSGALTLPSSKGQSSGRT